MHRPAASSCSGTARAPHRFFSLARRAHLLLLGAAILVALTPSTAAAQALSRVVGTLTNHKGEPVGGINIVFFNPGRGTTLEITTEPNGSFARTGLDPGDTYTITINTVGYLPLERTLPVSAGEIRVDLQLQGRRTPIGSTAKASKLIRPARTRRRLPRCPSRPTRCAMRASLERCTRTLWRCSATTTGG